MKLSKAQKEVLERAQSESISVVGWESYEFETDGKRFRRSTVKPLFVAGLLSGQTFLTTPAGREALKSEVTNG
jgi:hypothetical protein